MILTAYYVLELATNLLEDGDAFLFVLLQAVHKALGAPLLHIYKLFNH